MKARRLPPDPENMNDARAKWAQAAIDGFLASHRGDSEMALTDLLCDLMHWNDRETSERFNAVLARARRHYEAETEAVRS